MAMVKNRQDQTGEWEISISSSGKSLANSIHSVTNIPRITLPLDRSLVLVQVMQAAFPVPGLGEGRVCSKPVSMKTVFWHQVWS